MADMETATPVKKSAKPRGRGKPFTSGDPRVKPGPGRPALTPAERERRRLARIAHDRVVADVAAELRAMVGVALDVVRVMMDPDPQIEPSLRLRSAMTVLDRVHGLPVSTTVVAQVNTTVTPADRDGHIMTVEEINARALEGLRNWQRTHGLLQPEPVTIDMEQG